MFRIPLRRKIILIAFSVFTINAAALASSSPVVPPPVPAESFDIGTLHVDKFGSGAPPLILIPGLACGPWVWSDTVNKFAPTHAIYVITLPGFDGRPAATEKSLFAAFSRDFWTMLTARKIQKPIVIGHSLGGTLAVALAEEHPDRLAGIIAVDGLPVFPMLANATPQQRQAAAAQMAGTYPALSKEDQLAAEKNYMASIGTNKPEWVEPAARFEARSDPKSVAAWMSEDLTADLHPNLAKITIPFRELMPYDPADAKQPPAYTQEQTLAFYTSLIAGAPHATVRPIAPSRHFAMLDQPDAFYQAVTQFLTSAHP